ncbi:hypothetical protein BDZ89DRAFT_1079770 [Hymenopellis radicata]|nr:hypothetical protein BDZ89DRAFT_1079770 [Hymenopellis radicata]
MPPPVLGFKGLAQHSPVPRRARSWNGCRDERALDRTRLWSRFMGCRYETRSFLLGLRPTTPHCICSCCSLCFRRPVFSVSTMGRALARRRTLIHGYAFNECST